MISVIEIEAVSQGEGIVPFTGPPLRRALFKALSSQNPLLAKALEMSSNKIFVEAFLRDRRQLPCGFQDDLVYSGSEYRGSVIIFDDKTLVEAVKGWVYKKPTITIRDVPFKVVGYSYQEIDIEDFIQDQPCKNFRIRFLTPTCFRRTSTPYCYLYPNSKMVVSSASAVWNALSPKKGPETRIMSMWADLSVVETGYELCTTKPVEISEGRTLVGFMGWVNYKVVDHPEWHSGSHEEMATWLNTYLRFAELVGVGYMRNAGFGKIRFEVKRR